MPGGSTSRTWNRFFRARNGFEPPVTQHAQQVADQDQYHGVSDRKNAGVAPGRQGLKCRAAEQLVNREVHHVHRVAVLATGS